MLDVNDPKLTAYVLGELAENERLQVEAELEASDKLRQAVEEIRVASQRLTEQLAGEPCPELTAAQRDLIEASAAASADNGPTIVPSTESKPAGWKWAVSGVAAAAVLLLAYLGMTEWAGRVGREDMMAKHEMERSAANSRREMAKSKGSNQPAVTSSADPSAEDAQTAMKEYQSKMKKSMSRRPMGDKRESGATPGSPGTGKFSGWNSADNERPMEKSEGRRSDGASGPGTPADRIRQGSRHPSSETRPSRANRRPGKAAPGRNVGGGMAGGKDDDNGDSARHGGEPSSSGGDTGKGKKGGEGQAPGFSNQTEADDKKSAQPRRQGRGAVPSKNPQDGDLAGDLANNQNGGQSGGQKQGQQGEKGEQQGQQKGKDGVDGKSKKTPPAGKSNWRRDRVRPNTSKLSIGTNDDLPLQGMQMNVQIDGFRARVLLDCYYYNDRNRQLEGSFKLRLPNEASLYYVAFGQTNIQYRPTLDKLASKGFLTADMIRATGTGPEAIFKARRGTWANVKEARMVPKAKAALAYSETVRRRVDPALVEWTGSGIFQAKVFPLMPRKLHRIVIGYDVNLQENDGTLSYSLDMPRDVPEAIVDLNVSALPGTQATITPNAQPFLAGGRAYFHFKDPQEAQIKVELANSSKLVLVGQDEAKVDYFATRITPQLPAGEKMSSSRRAVFLVDTSLSSNPAKFNVWLDLMESTLENNRDSLKEFAVLFFNVETHWWREAYTPNQRENVAELMRYCQTLALEGATDLGQAVAAAMTPNWKEKKPAKTQPDFFLLSDGALTWGEDNLHLITKTLQKDGGATLFAYNTGLTGTAIQNLDQLARETGGAVFSLVNGNDVNKVSTAHRRRPWRLIDATVTGSSDLLIAGRIRSIYPGQSLLLVGRGKLGSEIVLRVQRGDERKVLRIESGKLVESDLVARTYGQVAVGQLEDMVTGIEDMASAYARHFRVAGRTSSLLMLESEADYRRFNIRPQQDDLVVKTTSVRDVILGKLDSLYKQLQDPKANVLAWLQRLEKTPGVQFRIPTALRLSLEQLPASAFEIKVPALICKQRNREDLPKSYFQQLARNNLNYDVIVAEARRRREKFSSSDALKALSSLIENNPGDFVLTRDVAFSAIEWDLGGQAYPLLKRVADARPFLPQVYQAMGQCLAAMDRADMAIVCYEIAMTGRWHQRYQDFHSICAVEYLHLLERIGSGKLDCQMLEYAKARRQSLRSKAPVTEADMIVTMMWSTDRTDVDLHVLEPSGEECSYKNRNTRTGGRITRDVTQGFGPEMYIIKRSTKGNYVVKAKYYGTDANRTNVRTKVYVTVYENFGTKRERVSRKTVMLSHGKQMRDLLIVERP